MINFKGINDKSRMHQRNQIFLDTEFSFREKTHEEKSQEEEWEDLVAMLFCERAVNLYETTIDDYPYYENEFGGQMVIPPLEDKEEIGEFVDGWKSVALVCSANNAITDLGICNFFIHHYTENNKDDDRVDIAVLYGNLYGYIWRVQNEMGFYDKDKTFMLENGCTYLKDVDVPQDYIRKLEKIAKKYHVPDEIQARGCAESGMTLTAQYMIHCTETFFKEHGEGIFPMITSEIYDKQNCNFMLMEE